MDLRVLRYLVAIVDGGSFGKAADQVHISQPALSKAIQQLEEELSATLLERGKRGTAIRLTPAGKVVYQHAQSLLEGRQKMIQELKALKRLERGHLKIGLSPLGSAELLAPIIAKFRARHPQIEIELLERGGAEQEAALRNGDIELATSLIPDDETFAWLTIHDDPLRIVLPNGHPLAQQTTVDLRDLAGSALVTFEASFILNKLIHQACLSAGFDPTEVTYVSQPDFGLALVAAGTGVMLLPELIAERHLTPGTIIKPLDNKDLRWQLSIIWRKEAVLSFAGQAMLELIKERFARVLKSPL